MKLYVLMLFLLSFSLVSSVVSEMGIFPDETIPSNINSTEMGQKADLLSQDMVDVSNDVDDGLGGVVALGKMALGAAKVLISTFGFFVGKLYFMLEGAGVPPSIAAMFQTIVSLVFAVSVFQIITNRGLKGYE